MRSFYTHLVSIESLVTELDGLELTSEQKIHLSSIIDSSLHHAIIDTVLSELSNEDKILFLKHLHENDHDKIWKFLNDRADSIETKIKNTADDLKKQLQDDIGIASLRVSKASRFDEQKVKKSKEKK